MSYTVKTDVFEGPFDLLLHLVARQKVDIAELSICDIADQYLAYVDRIQELDLDVASDFLLVAATLLEIKAASLLPRDEGETLEEYDDMPPEEARELLVARLLAYKQFKNAAAELSGRYDANARIHARAAALEEPFLHLMPDYLEGLTLRGLAVICADLLARREVVLLESDHIAATPISLEAHVESIQRTIRRRVKMSFSELMISSTSREELVVTFLAVLELYKRGEITLRQDEVFGEIEIDASEMQEAR